ncbi:hypothetical protein DFP92_105154 [Yoonia sediminilitoris]|uniref:Uncharacterized protein n=1 Tax=Yoonia sediminilitoris TaxID=1286148 RepID=A0A2T6KHE4_9RHOB|nr:hypothetical protein C8N45_105155 [Yoonia sediminilitoris]RCW95648.1 hypothetical protein DFP92_105154 [Yoonia sediminilitoris]
MVYALARVDPQRVRERYAYFHVLTSNVSHERRSFEATVARPDRKNKNETPGR